MPTGSLSPCHSAMRFRTWCTTWLLLALVGMTMATTAYFVKGFAGLIRSTRRMNVGSQAIYTEDNWAFSVSDYVVWIVQAMSVTLLSVLWTQLVAPQVCGFVFRAVGFEGNAVRNMRLPYPLPLGTDGRSWAAELLGIDFSVHGIPLF